MNPRKDNMWGLLGNKTPEVPLRQSPDRVLVHRQAPGNHELGVGGTWLPQVQNSREEPALNQQPLLRVQPESNEAQSPLSRYRARDRDGQHLIVSPATYKQPQPERDQKPTRAQQEGPRHEGPVNMAVPSTYYGNRPKEGASRDVSPIQRLETQPPRHSTPETVDELQQRINDVRSSLVARAQQGAQKKPDFSPGSLVPDPPQQLGPRSPRDPLKSPVGGHQWSAMKQSVSSVTSAIAHLEQRVDAVVGVAAQAQAESRQAAAEVSRLQQQQHNQHQAQQQQQQQQQPREQEDGRAALQAVERVANTAEQRAASTSNKIDGLVDRIVSLEGAAEKSKVAQKALSSAAREHAAAVARIEGLSQADLTDLGGAVSELRGQVSRVEASLSSEVAVQRAGWQALEDGVREAKRAAGEAYTVASQSAAQSNQANQTAKSAMSTFERLSSPSEVSSNGGNNNATAAMGAVVGLESRLVHGMIEPLSERMRKGIQEVAQMVEGERQARIESETHVAISMVNSGISELRQRVAGVEQHIARANTGSYNKENVFSSAVEARPSQASSAAATATVEAAAAVASAAVERRLARSMAEATASVLVGTEQLARRQESLAKELQGEVTARQKADKTAKRRHEDTAAALARHANASLSECRHTADSHAKRIAALEMSLRSQPGSVSVAVAAQAAAPVASPPAPVMAPAAGDGVPTKEAMQKATKEQISLVRAEIEASSELKLTNLKSALEAHTDGRIAEVKATIESQAAQQSKALSESIAAAKAATSAALEKETKQEQARVEAQRSSSAALAALSARVEATEGSLAALAASQETAQAAAEANAKLLQATAEAAADNAPSSNASPHESETHNSAGETNSTAQECSTAAAESAAPKVSPQLKALQEAASAAAASAADARLRAAVQAEVATAMTAAQRAQSAADEAKDTQQSASLQAEADEMKLDLKREVEERVRVALAELAASSPPSVQPKELEALEARLKVQNTLLEERFLNKLAENEALPSSSSSAQMDKLNAASTSGALAALEARVAKAAQEQEARMLAKAVAAVEMASQAPNNSAAVATSSDPAAAPSVASPFLSPSNSSGWNQVLDAAGNLYYWNEYTGESTWDRPAEMLPTPSPVPPPYQRQQQSSSSASQPEAKRLFSPPEDTSPSLDIPDLPPDASSAPVPTDIASKEEAISSQRGTSVESTVPPPLSSPSPATALTLSQLESTLAAMESRLAFLEMAPKAAHVPAAPTAAAAAATTTAAATVNEQQQAHDVSALLLPAAPPPSMTESLKLMNEVKPTTPPPAAATAADVPPPAVASADNAADNAAANAARDHEVAKLVTELAEERTKRMQMEARLAALEAALDINGTEWEVTLEVANVIKAQKKGQIAAPVMASGKVASKRSALGSKHMNGLFPPRPGDR